MRAKEHYGEKFTKFTAQKIPEISKPKFFCQKSLISNEKPKRRSFKFAKRLLKVKNFSRSEEGTV